MFENLELYNNLAALITNPLAYFEGISYIGIFFVIALSGYLVPVPEDALMVLAGYIAALGIVKFPLVVLVAFMAVLTADFVVYYLSYKGSRIALIIESKIKTNIFSWYAGQMRRRAFAVVFMSRFFPGLRTIGPLIAGFVKVKPGTFIFYSICSAIIYVPTMISIGYIFSEKITPLLGIVDSTRHTLFIVVIVAIAVLFGYMGHRKFFKKKGENGSDLKTVSESISADGNNSLLN